MRTIGPITTSPQELLLESLAKIRRQNMKLENCLHNLMLQESSGRMRALKETRKQTTRLSFIALCAMITAVSCATFAALAYGSLLWGL